MIIVLRWEFPAEDQIARIRSSLKREDLPIQCKRSLRMSRPDADRRSPRQAHAAQPAARALHSDVADIAVCALAGHAEAILRPERKHGGARFRKRGEHIDHAAAGLQQQLQRSREQIRCRFKIAVQEPLRGDLCPVSEGFFVHLLPLGRGDLPR